MKNSQDIIERINKIEGLEDEIIIEVVKDDLKGFEMIKKKKQFIEQLLGKTEELSEEEIIDKLVEIYKKQPPYLGYCHKYWGTKKSILKEKYNIEWYTPSEENPECIYD